MNLLDKIAELEGLAKKATPGQWWANGMDVESSHVTVGEGEELTQLYDTATEKPYKQIKRYATEGPFTKAAQSLLDDDILIFTTSSILGDRSVQEALATAEYIAACFPQQIITLCTALRECIETLKDYSEEDDKFYYDLTLGRKAASDCLQKIGVE